jgi:hypothetical protein
MRCDPARPPPLSWLRRPAPPLTAPHPPLNGPTTTARSSRASEDFNDFLQGNNILVELYPLEAIGDVKRVSAFFRHYTRTRP